jgi:hypothetical protein
MVRNENLKKILTRSLNEQKIYGLHKRNIYEGLMLRFVEFGIMRLYELLHRIGQPACV